MVHIETVIETFTFFYQKYLNILFSVVLSRKKSKKISVVLIRKIFQFETK